MSVKTITFFCEWSSYPGLQLTLFPGEETDSNHKMMVAMCQGRISPELILEAFSNGAAGVMIACCPPDECEHDANYKAVRRFFLLKSILREFGINPKRLRIEKVSKGDAAGLKKIQKSFESEIEELGPIASKNHSRHGKERFSERLESATASL